MKNNWDRIRHRVYGKNSLVILLSCLLCGSVLTAEGESSGSDDLFKYKVLNDIEMWLIITTTNQGKLKFQEMNGFFRLKSSVQDATTV